MLLTVCADFKVPSKADKATLARLNYHAVIFGLNDNFETTGKLKWSGLYPLSPADRLAKETEEIRATGKDVIWMIWLRPDMKFSRNLFNVLISAIEAGAQPSAILFDVELPWRQYPRLRANNCEGYRVIVKQLFDDHWGQLTLPIGISSYAIVPDEVESLLPYADFVFPQAYSIWNPKMKWTTEPEAAPGTLQKTAYKSWMEHPALKPDAHCIMGLPVYSLSRPASAQGPKMTAEQAFAAAVQGSREAGCSEVAIWSLKHLVPELSKNPKRRLKFIDFINEEMAR